jgi:hypothetical protein
MVYWSLVVDDEPSLRFQTHRTPAKGIVLKPLPPTRALVPFLPIKALRPETIR